MPRSSSVARDAPTVASALSKAYGDVTHANKSNPLSELLYILCSLQTNERLYQSTYAALRSQFPSFKLLASASEDAIAAAISRGGLARQKARAIRKILSRVVNDFGAPTLAPLKAMDDATCESYLTSLPGVGLKTARCVMMYSLGRRVFPVDSNCWRICRRLGWFKATRPDKSCSARDMDRVQAAIPPALRFQMHVGFVSHGRSICTPSLPKCHQCSIYSVCKHSR